MSSKIIWDYGTAIKLSEQMPHVELFSISWISWLSDKLKIKYLLFRIFCSYILDRENHFNF